MYIRAILFDLDGTLVDSNELHVRAWTEAFRDVGHAVDADAVRKQIGKGADHLVPALVPGADAETARTLGDRHGEIFKTRYLDLVRPFPHAHDLLARVHDSGRKVVFASSASKGELDHYADLLGATTIMAAGTSIDDVTRSKPAPDIFAVALGKLDGVAASAALAVGDSPYDERSASASGVATVAVRSGGFSDDELSGAIALYDDVAELLAGFPASPLAR